MAWYARIVVATGHPFAILLETALFRLDLDVSSARARQSARIAVRPTFRASLDTGKLRAFGRKPPVARFSERQALPRSSPRWR